MRTRAAGIIINKGRIALIERNVNDEIYYLFPGGGVEDGEEIEEALIREIKEELGLRIKIRNLVAIVHRNGNDQYYYLTEVIGGDFGSGDGDEIIGNIPKERGKYTPMWMNIDQIQQQVRPQCISKLVVKSRINGWPNKVANFID